VAGSSDAAASDVAATDGPSAAVDGDDGAGVDAATGSELLLSPIAFVSAGAVDFGSVPCASQQTQTLSLTNRGNALLAASATVAGGAFSLTPTTLALSPGETGTFNVSVAVLAAATAGAPLSGSLSLFTNDPTRASVQVPLEATPTGATLEGSASYEFAPDSTGAAPPLTVQLTNGGNAPAVFAVAAPSDPRVTLLSLSDGGYLTLNAGETWTATASLAPGQSAVSATSSIDVTSVVCGASLASVTFVASAPASQASGPGGGPDAQ
jgi:hypothetical protein